MNTNTTLSDKLEIILIVGIIAVAIVSIRFSMNNKDKPVVAINRENYEIQTHTIDSLKTVSYNLQNEIITLENKFDSREHRYEDIIFQYELGLSYLKDYHPTAYKDFHRIIGMRERFSIELERENAKKLNSKEL
jgi:hypothetical protein